MSDRIFRLPALVSAVLLGAAGLVAAQQPGGAPTPGAPGAGTGADEAAPDAAGDPSARPAPALSVPKGPAGDQPPAAAGGERTYTVERDFDALRQGLAADLERVVQRLDRSGREFRDRVNQRIDALVVRLEKLREVLLSIEAEVHQTFETLKALTQTLQEALSLSLEDMETVIDDLIVALLGEEMKNTLHRLGLDPNTEQNVTDALDGVIIPGTADAAKQVLRGLHQFRLRLRERMTPRQYRSYQEEQAQQQAAREGWDQDEWDDRWAPEGAAPAPTAPNAPAPGQ